MEMIESKRMITFSLHPMHDSDIKSLGFCLDRVTRGTKVIEWFVFDTYEGNVASILMGIADGYDQSIVSSLVEGALEIEFPDVVITKPVYVPPIFQTEGEQG
jgi:hypothetical protein